MPEDFESVYDWWMAGELSAKRASDCLGVSHQTFERFVREYEEEKTAEQWRQNEQNAQRKREINPKME